MHVQDLAARLDQLRAVLAAQRGRRHRLLNWKSQTDAVFEHQAKVVREMGDESAELARKVDANAAEFEGVQRILEDVTAEHSRVFLVLRTEESELDRVKEATESDRQKAKENREAAELRISNAEKLISTLNHDVETHHVSRRKLLQKKLDMIRELSKRLAAERQNCTSIEIGSSKVEELTQAVSTEMLEKQDMLAEIKKRKEQLKWLQAETQKKSAIIAELKKMIKPRSSESPTNRQTLDDFDQLVGNLEVQNECHLENLQIAGFEMGGLEEEKASLMSILADLRI
jgi:chromosome segregation ATPase